MPLRILLVDDDQVDRLAASRALRQIDLEVDIQEGTDGASGLAKLRLQPFDCVLLDYHLPDMNGGEFLTSLAALPVSQRPAVVMLTGRGNADIAVDVMKRGGQDYLAKDKLQPALLQQAIDRAINVVTLQRQRHQAEERFRRVIESAPSALVMVNRQGHIVLVNSQAERLFGYGRQELLGQAVELLVPQRWRQQHQHNRDAFFAQPTERPMGYGRELYGQRKDASEFPIEITLTPLEMEDGPVVLGTIVDITERQRLEAERHKLAASVQKAQKIQSLMTLTSGIAHDFNNLLTGMLGYAELALMDIAPGLPTHGHLTQIRQVALRAAELVQQMLIYSGSDRLTEQNIDLVRLLQEMLPVLQAGLAHNIILRCEATPQLPCIHGEPQQICQAVGSLLTNAAEAYGERQGVITIRTRQVDAQAADLVSPYFHEELLAGSYVELAVVDTGCGMDEVTTQRMFDPFFTTKFLGRGLGLAAVLGIVRNHRGSIRVSSAPGQGTTVYLLFPSADLAMGEGDSGPFIGVSSAELQSKVR